MEEGTMTTLDLHTTPLPELVDFDFRAPGRDVVADVRTVQARVEAFLDGIADPDWTRPIADSAVAGAPPWTLLDHVGHLADWNDEACRYIVPLLTSAAALRTGGRRRVGGAATNLHSVTQRAGRGIAPTVFSGSRS
jgi:hypothetical protein